MGITISCNSLTCDSYFKIYLLSVNGMEIMTPFPVPTHKRLQDTIRAVILTKEKPSFPVPVGEGVKEQFIEKLEGFRFQIPRRLWLKNNKEKVCWKGTLKQTLLCACV